MVQYKVLEKSIKCMLKIIMNFVVASAVTILLMLPDKATYLLCGINRRLDISFAAWIFCFAFAFTLQNMRQLRQKIASILMLGMLGIVQTGALLHVHYFGVDLSPSVMKKALENPAEDIREVLFVLLGGDLESIGIILITVICYIISYILLRRMPGVRIGKNLSALPVIAVFVIFAFPLVRAAVFKNVYMLHPIQDRSPAHNLFNTFGLSMNKHMDNSDLLINYSKRSFVREAPKAQNIVLIIGESATPKYMSLFGYKTITTPLLEEYRYAENFVHKKAVSISVGTSASLPLFFNLMNHPEDMRSVFNREVNIFKLAKEQGYKTILITAQSSTLFPIVGMEYLDHFIAKEHIDNKIYEAERDLILLRLLKEIELKERNFIVLHQRAVHVPYDSNYKHMPELSIFQDDKIKSAASRSERETMLYSNAMRYNDFVLNEIINYFKENIAKGESYLFFTSDHGELFGENGLFGHNHLHQDCALVPFFVYSKDGDTKFISDIKKMKLLSHYDIGVLIANRMGGKIVSSALRDQSRYVYDTSIFANYKLLKYDLGCEKEACLFESMEAKDFCNAKN